MSIANNVRDCKFFKFEFRYMTCQVEGGGSESNFFGGPNVRLRNFGALKNSEPGICTNEISNFQFWKQEGQSDSFVCTLVL